jgi:hypothetical protein
VGGRQALSRSVDRPIRRVFYAVMKHWFAAAAILALLLVGCGSAEYEPSLVEATKRTEAAGSLRFEIRGVESEAGARITVSCDGAVDYTQRRSRVECTYGDTGTLDFLSIGDATYLRTTGDLFGTGAAAGDQKKWIRMDDGDAFHDEFSPEKVLTLLRKAALETERLGEEDVRGVPAVRYRLTVDREKAELTSGDGDTTTVDVWIDDEGLVRRIEAKDDGRFTLEFFDFGVAVDVEPPSPDEITTLDSGGEPKGSVTKTPCPSFEAKPITSTQAIEALRRNDFTIDEGTLSCSTSAMWIDNSASDALEREGELTCFLTKDGPMSPLSSATLSGNDLGKPLQLENLYCIASGGTKADPPRERVTTALDELKETIRP